MFNLCYKYNRYINYMLKLTDSVKDIINSNSFLNSGISSRLLNLSSVAKLIKPLVEARTKKDVKTSAILMSLSRIQRESHEKAALAEKFEITNLTVYSSLCSITFFESQGIQNKISEIYKEIKKNNGRITLIQGVGEIAVIIDENQIPIIEKHIKEPQRNMQKNLAALGIYFNPKHYETPGFIHYITQQIAFQGISIYEISSTFSEITIYVDQKNIRLLFDTIHNSFSLR